jgi:hypothetical protein
VGFHVEHLGSETPFVRRNKGLACSGDLFVCGTRSEDCELSWSPHMVDMPEAAMFHVEHIQQSLDTPVGM